MTGRQVALLRGVNVGGRRITGPEMVEIAAGAGFEGASSYQASGNLVFDTDLARRAIEARVAHAWAAARDWEIEVFVRTLPDLVAAVERLPFTADQMAGLGKPQVGFAHAAVDVSALTVDRDLVAAEGTEIYWVPHTGVSDADLDMADFSRLDGPVTFRTLGTIERIISKFG